MYYFPNPLFRIDNYGLTMKPNSLFACLNFKKIDLELHVLSNIFNIEKRHDSVQRFLVNSANEYLVSTQLPYFPRGGLPRLNNVLGGPGSWQFSTGWGGMEAGGGMVYPAQTLDGELATRCPDMASWIREHVAPVVTRDPHHALDTADPGPRMRRLPLTRDQVRCVTGGSVWAPVSGPLAAVFPLGALHTVAPYNSDPDRDPRLEQCYASCLALAASKVREDTSFSVVTALLGTGVKCIEHKHSAVMLREAIVKLERDDNFLGDKSCKIELVLQSTELCELLLVELEK